MTTSPALAFALLLAGLLFWLALPIIPAMMELIWPRDAVPLNAVGNDAGNLTYFAESFTARAHREGLLGTMVPPRLTDGSPVIAHSQAQPLPSGRKAVKDLVVLMDAEPVPAGTEFSSECLARLTLRGSENVTYRALLGQRDVLLGARSTVLRWVHARGRLEVAEGCRLLGRATADRSIVLAPGVAFDRLESDVVRVGGAETVDAPILPTGAYEMFVPKKATMLGTHYWRTQENLLVPAGAALIGSAISTAAIVVDQGARVTGSLKAHGDLRICAGSVVVGSVAARGRITIERGAKVSGPIISETGIVVEAAVIGGPGKRTTITAPAVRLYSGATVYGAIMAGDDGLTLA
jgi:predicted acyltransferase (DUF342 family)